MEMKIVSTEQTNAFFDKGKSRNGGGYDQPKYCLDFVKDGDVVIKAVLEDKSCGDFGTRFYASLTHEKSNNVLEATWGSMLDKEFISDHFYSKEVADDMVNAFFEMKAGLLCTLPDSLVKYMK